MVIHLIKLEEDIRAFISHHRIPTRQISEVQQHIKEGFDQRIIRECSRSFVSAVVIVRKKDRRSSICRLLVPRTKQENNKGSVFARSKKCLNIQVAVDESAVDKRAFSVGTGGLHQYIRMPFGLCNSLETLQGVMEACFTGENFKILLLYLTTP